MIKIFNQLATTNSVKDKEAILKANSSNEKLKWLLEANLNPYKLYQFNKMPCEFEKEYEVEHTQEWKFDFLKGLLVDLEKRHLTGNKAKDAVCATFKLFDKEHFELYSKILLKESIGVGASTVNKVWPGLIPQFKLMLAPSELPNITTLQYPLYVQPKYDGFRCVYSEGKLWTRSGLIMPNKNLQKHFETLVGIDSYMFDGELYLHGGGFQNLATILNSDEAPVPKGLKYFIYDCMPIADWKAQKTKLGYSDRLKLIREQVNGVLADYSKYVDAPTDLAENSAEVIEIYKKYLKSGYEGCMLKAQEGKYQWKRVTLKSGEMIKLKPFKSLDLEVTGIYDGEGKFEGKAGGILVDYNGVAVRVGSGFDDATRDILSKESNRYIGKTAEIKYFEETEDGSLRFPIFERWRDDK
jgi:DNA ligase-1